MVRAAAILGLVLIVAGAGMFFAYYPAVGKTAAQLKSVEDTSSGVAYRGYSAGSQVLVFGEITKLSYDSNSGSTSVQLDFIDLTPVSIIVTVYLNFVVGGDLGTKHAVGDKVQMRAALDASFVVGNFKIHQWKVVSASEVQPMILMQGVFIGVAAAGFLVLVIGMGRKRGATPAG
jgi:hypothetical protein